MPCYKLIVEYNGTRFNGFQRQTATPPLTTNANEEKEAEAHHKKRPRPRDSSSSSCTTIQQALEDALVGWTGHSVAELRLRSAGRTDKGVHSRANVVAIDLSPKENMKEWEMQRATNSRLPPDISISSFTRHPVDGWEPRLAAESKIYTYTIKYRRLAYHNKKEEDPSTGNIILDICTRGGIHSMRSAFQDGLCVWHCPWALEDAKFDKVCGQLTGRHDFRAFVHKRDRDKKNHTLTLSRFDYESLSTSQQDTGAPVILGKFTVQASGFRRGMVRHLVGFVVDVARNQVSIEDLDQVWQGTDAAAAMVNMAPASGLCLEQVLF